MRKMKMKENPVVGLWWIGVWQDISNMKMKEKELSWEEREAEDRRRK